MKKATMTEKYEMWKNLYIKELIEAKRMSERECYLDKLSGVLALASELEIITYDEKNQIFHCWLDWTYSMDNYLKK